MCYIADEQKLNLSPGKYTVQVKLADKVKGGQEGTLVAYSDKFIEFVPKGNKKILNEVFLALGEASELKDQKGEGCLMS